VKLFPLLLCCNLITTHREIKDLICYQIYNRCVVLSLDPPETVTWAATVNVHLQLLLVFKYNVLLMYMQLLLMHIQLLLMYMQILLKYMQILLKYMQLLLMHMQILNSTYCQSQLKTPDMKGNTSS